MTDGFVVRQTLAGGFANRMFEHLSALALVRLIPGAQLTGDALPNWRIRPPRIPLPPRHIKVEGHRIDLPRLLYLASSGLIQGVDVTALGCRMELVGPPSRARAIFVEKPLPDPGFEPEDLVISIRGGEILHGVHKDYRPLPPSFYERVITLTGRRPVFLGQIGDDAYSEALRRRFPTARFLPSRGAMEDFAALRQARHLVVAISTFSWLAAWLSQAEEIHLPIAGMFHPTQRPEVDLLPVTDPRYRFHLFPVMHWKGTPAELDAVVTDAGSGQEIGRDEALKLLHPRVVLETS